MPAPAPAPTPTPTDLRPARTAQAAEILDALHDRLSQHPGETAFVVFEVPGGDRTPPPRRRFVQFVATEERLLLDLPLSLFRGDERARLLAADRGYWRAVDRPEDCRTPGTQSTHDQLRRAWPWSEQPLACAEIFWLLFDFWRTPEPSELVAEWFAVAGPERTRTAWGETPLAGQREPRSPSAAAPSAASSAAWEAASTPEPCPCCGRTPQPGALDEFDPTWREPGVQACRFCRRQMHQGILLVEVEDWGGGPPGKPRRTGRVACVAESGIRRCVLPPELADHTVRQRFAFVSQAAWKSFGLAQAGELN